MGAFHAKRPDPIRLMLVDDMVAIRRHLWTYLERTGDFTVVGEAGDGAAAVDLARELQPELILLDVAMPVMDGLQALPLLKLASPRSCVMMFSGSREARTASEARRRGASGYIEKGTPPREVAARLRRVRSCD